MCIAVPLTTRPGRIARRSGASARDLRRRRFDLVIDFHGGPRGSWLSWLTRAPQRIGYTVPGRSWMYTQAVARPRQLRPRHSVENQWDLLAALGIAAAGPHAGCRRDGAERRTSRARVDARLQSSGIAPGRPLVVMHVSAGNPFRRWPVDRFAAVAARLVAGRSVAASSCSRRVRSEAGAADEAAREARQRAPLRRWRPGSRAAASSTSRSCARWSGAPRSTSAATAGRCTSPARRGRRSSGCMDRRCRCARRRGATRRFRPRRSSGRTLACRPCDQRDCVHGDFRCLTSLTADSVVAARTRRCRVRSPTAGDRATDNSARDRRPRAWHTSERRHDDDDPGGGRTATRSARVDGRRRPARRSWPRCSCRLRRPESAWRVTLACWAGTLVLGQRAMGSPAVLLAAAGLRGAGRWCRRPSRRIPRTSFIDSQAARAVPAGAGRLPARRAATAR